MQKLNHFVKHNLHYNLRDFLPLWGSLVMGTNEVQEGALL